MNLMNMKLTTPKTHSKIKQISPLMVPLIRCSEKSCCCIPSKTLLMMPPNKDSINHKIPVSISLSSVNF